MICRYFGRVHRAAATRMSLQSQTCWAQARVAPSPVPTSSKHRCRRLFVAIEFLRSDMNLRYARGSHESSTLRLPAKIGEASENSGRAAVAEMSFAAFIRIDRI